MRVGDTAAILACGFSLCPPRGTSDVVDAHGNVVGLREHSDDVNTEAARHTRRRVFVLSILLLILMGLALFQFGYADKRVHYR